MKNVFKIPKTCFSASSIDRNFRTALHRDAGDYKEGFGNLTVIERGKYVMGVIPVLNLVSVWMLDVVIFWQWMFMNGTPTHLFMKQKKIKNLMHQWNLLSKITPK